MKLVVLDGYTLNPGDLSWENLRSLADCDIHERTPPEAIVSRAQDAEMILINKCPISAQTLGQLPNLRYIGVLATGYNVVDVAAASEREITVTNVPAYGTRSVAQHVFALILELSNAVGHHAEANSRGAWSQSQDWCYWNRPLLELDGLVLGIIGYGRIGRAVASIAESFGMQVVAYSPRETPGARKLALDELLRKSDFVSLHCPLTPETEGIINRDKLALMKSSAFLINTARGQLIVEKDLADALNNRTIAGAALDVLTSEPPASDNPLLTARNCIVTPHIAWASFAARERLLSIVEGNIRAFLAGTPENVIRITG